MSEQIIKLAIQGYQEQLNDTKKVISKYENKIPADKKIEFPETAYNLPLYFAFSGKKIQSLLDVQNLIYEIEKKNSDIISTDINLNKTLDLGIDTIILQELSLAVESSAGEKINFIPDNVLRSLGVQLVSGDISGIAVIVGAAKDEDSAVNIIRSFQEKNILSVLAADYEGKTMYEQLSNQNVEMLLDTYIVYLGSNTESVVLGLNWAVRTALTYGGIQGGQKEKCLKYCAERIPAFAMVLGGVDAKKVATAVGAIAMGFPVICNFEVPEISVKDEQGFEQRLLTFEMDPNKIVDKCLEVRNIKVKITDVPIPVRYSSAFEGERVRKEDVAIEFGGKYSKALEFVEMKNLDEVENGKIQVIGKEIDEVEEGSALPLGIVVYVAGREMQKDFEPVIERRIHSLINHATGIMHIGQRSIVWLRISKNAKKSGFKIKHLGTIIHTKFLDEFPSIIDKVEVHIYTEEEKVNEFLKRAEKLYNERDQRMGEMTDESVDVFYSCTLCQSFAPNHVCIITPERPGLCGAYNWLDGKTAFQISPTGPNQPVRKGELINAEIGEWKGVNEFVYKASNKTLERFSAYSLIKYPMTSCGCFECIIAILPGTGGFMIVDRTFLEMTPCGMTFSTLAGVVGGGQQTPGFLGIGLNYIISKKFVSAEGGLKRLVWMPSYVKERFREKLVQRAGELEVPDLINKIADETITKDISGLIEFLTEKQHPALKMGELI
ncbi:MAG: CO dehydrogenase/CO-methylating acetyl-CoA synthase complex subunit beta [Candidatus Cloacimonetes bacterium]|nr:CO dehydrogenase/CO-methylating acetyl-CoA synthase complex subunit beta [Candidatus Cloacimonadota bacterium]